jgi:hypothetical protein
MGFLFLLRSFLVRYAMGDQSVDFTNPMGAGGRAGKSQASLMQSSAIRHSPVLTSRNQLGASVARARLKPSLRNQHVRLLQRSEQNRDSLAVIQLPLDLRHPTDEWPVGNGYLFSGFKRSWLYPYKSIRLDSIADARDDLRLDGDRRLTIADHAQHTRDVANRLPRNQGTKPGKQITRKQRLAHQSWHTAHVLLPLKAWQQYLEIELPQPRRSQRFVVRLRLHGKPICLSPKVHRLMLFDTAHTTLSFRIPRVRFLRSPEFPRRDMPAVIKAPIAALPNVHETLPGKLLQRHLRFGYRRSDSLLEQPPLVDSFDRVIGPRTPAEIRQNLSRDRG